MVAPNKQRMLTKLLSVLSKNYKPQLPDDLTVLDHIILGVVQEGMPFSRSVETFRELTKTFHDFNELRVSHVDEIAHSLDKDVTDRAGKARRIVQVLQFVFETTYSYDLEQMRRKPLKQAQKQISKIAGVTPFVVNAVVQRSLGGHALPIDQTMSEILLTLEIADPPTSDDQAMSSIEHLVPKAKGLAFCLQLSDFAFESPRKQKPILKDLLGSSTASSKTAKSTGSAPAKKKTTKKK